MLTNDMIMEAKKFAHMLMEGEPIKQPLGQSAVHSSMNHDIYGVDEAMSKLEQNGAIDRFIDKAFPNGLPDEFSAGQPVSSSSSADTAKEDNPKPSPTT